MVMGAQRKGIKLTYCTDTRPTQSIVDHADHSDLFICEGMYGEKDKEAKAREYKHMTCLLYTSGQNVICVKVFCDRNIFFLCQRMKERLQDMRDFS